MARGATRSAAKPNRPVALVTGAANGIGRAITHHLLDAGWCVLAVDLAAGEMKVEWDADF